MVLLVAIVVFSGCLLPVVQCYRERPPFSPDAVVRRAQREVEGFLLSPATASFVWDGKVYLQQNGTYLATGSVDAQNAFGAILRKKWKVLLAPRPGQDPEDGDLVYVEIGGDVYVDHRNRLN